VNPDASLSFAVRGMHARARHVYGMARQSG
jgi:hypothetical protein